MTQDPYLISPNRTIQLHGIEFPAEYLFRHLLITGAPGSGKTRLILLPLIEQILTSFGSAPDEKAAMIFADPKGELQSLLKPLLQRCSRENDLVVLGPEQAFYNPLSNPFLTQAEIVEQLVQWAKQSSRSARGDSMAQESMYWENAMRHLLSALVAIARLNSQVSGVLTLGDVVRIHDSATHINSKHAAVEWLAGFKFQPSPDTRRAINEYGMLPDATRACVQTSVSNVIYPWTLEPLKSLVAPNANRIEVDPLDIIDQGKVLLISCSGPAYGTSITPLLAALKEHFFASILSRSEISVVEGGTSRLINQTRPVFFVADEFQSYMSTSSTTGEVAALDRLRCFRCGYIAATQNLSSIYSTLNSEMHGRRLLALFSNQLFLNNIDLTTADYAFATLNPTLGIFDDPIPPLPPALLKGRPPVPKRYSPGALTTLQTGEFWLRLANGRIHHAHSHHQSPSSS